MSAPLIILNFLLFFPVIEKNHFVDRPTEKLHLPVSTPVIQEYVAKNFDKLKNIELSSFTLMFGGLHSLFERSHLTSLF
jgi:hypothetical protein